MEDNKVPIAKIKLSNNLKLLRTNKGLSINSVAEEMHITYSYLHALEDINVCKNPSLEVLDRLSEYYKVEVYELFM